MCRCRRIARFVRPWGSECGICHRVKMTERAGLYGEHFFVRRNDVTALAATRQLIGDQISPLQSWQNAFARTAIVEYSPRRHLCGTQCNFLGRKTPTVRAQTRIYFFDMTFHLGPGRPETPLLSDLPRSEGNPRISHAVRVQLHT